MLIKGQIEIADWKDSLKCVDVEAFIFYLFLRGILDVWRWLLLLSEAPSYWVKIPIPVVGYLPGRGWSGSPRDPPLQIQTFAIVVGCLPELHGKTLLLKYNSLWSQITELWNWIEACLLLPNFHSAGGRMAIQILLNGPGVLQLTISQPNKSAQ